MIAQGKIRDRISDTNWFVYVLRLEQNKYYIGIATNPKERFLEHKNHQKNCASWCKKYNAVELMQIIDTNTKLMVEATLIEDIYTLKYIEKYGFENVRGGRYIGSELKIKNNSKSHLIRGYISVLHKLFEDVNISYSELKEFGIYEYVVDSRNTLYINNLILITRNEREQKKLIIDKVLQLQCHK
jgi:predicted GIY-YIG superfamily endonuclease